MPDGYADEIPTKKEITRFPIDWYRNFGLSEQTSAMRLFRDKDGMLLAIPVTPFMSNASTGLVTNVMPSGIVDSQPGTDGTNVFARCFGTPATNGDLDTTIGLVVNSRGMSYSYVFGKWVGIIDYSSKTLSSVHTAKVITLTPLQTSGAKQNMTIIVTCSAGTATLLFEVSPDNTTWFTVDTLGAAATNILNYIPTSVGGTTAINPLAFPYMRITAGDAGVGNTTTTSIALK